MIIGQVFRYSRPYEASQQFKDELPNYFYHTRSPGTKLALLEAGINPIQEVGAPDGPRCPAILISSSPHKAGSEATPWQDFFDPDRGHIRYFGDNKPGGKDPARAKGNQALLRQFALHTSSNEADRAKACPIIFFRRVEVAGRAKGNVQFQGFGVITKVERVTQYHRRTDSPFTNYVFDFCVFSLTGEKELFDWSWITARRSAVLLAGDHVPLAPASWKVWIRDGLSGVERCRRRIVKLLTVNTAQQRPQAGRELQALQTIYEYYDRKKSRFEALAALISARVIAPEGNQYRHGWITPASSDGGADFVGRLDVGSGFSRTKLVVLGQAKCEQLDAPTGGNHIARTVARLKRGWVGVYVTTSYFSESVQREVLEDKYPIVLINGQRLAQEVLQLVHEKGLPDVQTLLEDVERRHEGKPVRRDPEEILFE